jgi:hypothetical protein
MRLCHEHGGKLRSTSLRFLCGWLHLIIKTTWFGSQPGTSSGFLDQDVFDLGSGDFPWSYARITKFPFSLFPFPSEKIPDSQGIEPCDIAWP